MRTEWSRVLVVGGLLSGACTAVPVGSGTGPATPPTDAVEADEPGAEPEAIEEEAAVAPSSEPAATLEPETSSGEGPVDLAAAMVGRECEALCVRTDELCTEAEARRCREQCKNRVEESAGCEVPYKAALKCWAQSDKKALCASVEPPACREPFRRIERCQERREEEEAKQKRKELPAGWAPIKDEQLDFTIALPASAALDSGAERRTWRAQDGDVEYVVAQLTAPGKAVTSQVLLKLVLEFVGYPCQKNLKLHGQFETMGEVAIRFDTQCKDGTEWHGMLRARPDQGLATAFRAPLQSGVLEPFIYSYKRLQ